jgi:hypothetical protein
MQESEQPASIRQARCDCGQLSFVVRGEPVHIHACACTMCQRSSGSVMSYSAWFPRTAVEIQGEFTTHHHRGAEHSDRFRCFCPTCGTGRFFQSGSSFPDTVAFAAGIFAGLNVPPPSAILYWDDRPAWIGEPAGITVYPQDDE